MSPITIFIPGDPHGQGRARRSANGGMYKEKRDRRYERRVVRAFYESGCMAVKNDENLYGGAITIEITAVFKPPRLSSKKLELLRYVTKTPDIDNIAKAILDGLNKMAFKDDRQVIEFRARKVWAHNHHDLEMGVYATISYLGK
jgi:Holliday junction resolvase RusA-like endonuclease